MKKDFLSWAIFIVLSIIWGSSFILIRTGLDHLSPYHVAALRSFSAGLLLLPVTIKHIRSIPRNKLGYVFLSGLLGSFFPSFLFCLAQEGIDSSLAGTLNSLTPIFTVIIGTLFFHAKAGRNKVIGIVIAFIGCILLLFSKGVTHNKDIFFSGFVIVATLFYGLNVNLVQNHLNKIGSLKIAAVALTFCAIPAGIVLLLTGYFSLPLGSAGIIKGTAAGAVLGFFGTALATVIFYMLIKRAGAIFSSMVTYGIPFVALIWGIIFRENINALQIASLLLILAGVYFASRNERKITVLPD